MQVGDIVGKDRKGFERNRLAQGSYLIGTDSCGPGGASFS